MSQENIIQDLTFKAKIDLSGDAGPTTSERWRAVKLDSNAQEIDDIAADSDVVIGVLKNLPELGDLATVTTLGTTKARAGGAIVRGVRCKIDADGKFISGGGGGDRNWGICLEAAAADGDVFEMLLTGLIVT